jgi:GNAT superfamily N-acetyltransferase
MAGRLAGVFPDFKLETFPERHHFDPPHRVEPQRVAELLLALWRRADEPVLRVATLADEPAVDALMKASGEVLFRRFYDERQAASAVEYVAQVDRALLEDGTYFVLESGGELVGCGGWSKRDKLYTGSGDSAGDDRLLDPAREPARVRAMFVRADWTRRGLGRRILEACEAAAKAEGFTQLSLVATLPGLPLYRTYGFTELEHRDVVMPDGVAIPCVAMEKPIGD